MSQITDELNVRVGRFVPRFGINTPEHVFSTRAPLGFGYQTERDTAEVTYLNRNWDASLALSVGELRDSSDAGGVYSQLNYSVGNHKKIGVSLEKKSSASKDFSFGVHGLLGLTEKFYLMGDTVFRDSRGVGGQKMGGIYHFTKVGYELEKGIHLIAIGDLNKKNITVESSTESMYGVGLTLFPRPHFEVQGVFTKRKVLAKSQKEGDYAWLMMHFYL